SPERNSLAFGPPGILDNLLTRCNVTRIVTYVTQWHTCTCLRQRHCEFSPQHVQRMPPRYRAERVGTALAADRQSRAGKRSWSFTVIPVQGAPWPVGLAGAS